MESIRKIAFLRLLSSSIRRFSSSPPSSHGHESFQSISSQAEDLAKEADRVCKILISTQTIPAALDNAGIRSLAPDLVSEILKRLSNGGTLALSFFRWAERQQQKGFCYESRSFHYLIEALGKIKQFRQIWALVDFMKSRGLLTKEAFRLISRRYARARKIEDAIMAFEKMEIYGFNLDLSDFNALLDTLCKSKHVRRAQDLFDEMTLRKRRFSPDIKTFTILLEGWGFERDLKMMSSVYQRMMEEGGFEPDIVTHGILINSLTKSGRLDEALEFFDAMEIRNMKPTPHIYCTLINAFGSNKRLEEALRLFARTKSSGFPPETPTYNAMVGAFCWSARFDDAFNLVAEMKEHKIGPNTRTYDVILHHLIRVRRPEEAYRVFQGMDGDENCSPELNTYTMIVNMFCKEERVDMAMKVWKEMKEKGVLPCSHMFSVLINRLCFENRLEEACRYFREMLENGLRPPGALYETLKESLVEGGKKELAVELGLELERLKKNPSLTCSI